jgi:hypothetical protein
MTKPLQRSNPVAGAQYPRPPAPSGLRNRTLQPGCGRRKYRDEETAREHADGRGVEKCHRGDHWHVELKRTPIKPVSDKRAAENRERAEMIARKFPERPLCIVYQLSQQHPGVIPGEVTSRCSRRADDVHEPLTRARGGSVTDPGNATSPCRPCHDALGKEPSWGYKLGLLRHSWDQPGRHA